jgi:hypothetical protein
VITLVTSQHPKMFEKALSTLNRKARRLGVEEITYTLLKQGKEEKSVTFLETQDGESREHTTKVQVDVWTYEVSHLDIVQNGWEVIAKITPSDDDSPYVESFRKDLDHKKYEKYDPCNCDHCHTSRNRKHSWIVYNREDGLERQVGSTCLKDLTDGHTASLLEFVSHIYVVLRSLEEYDSLGGSFGGHQDDYNFHRTLESIASVVEWMKTHKWENNEYQMCSGYTGEYKKLVKGGTHRQVADKLKLIAKGGNAKGITPTSDSLEKAELIIETLSTLEVDDDNDFMKEMSYNLSQPAIPAKKLSLVCYAPRAYEQHLQDLDREVKKSKMKYVGEIKQRLDFELTVTNVYSFETDWGLTHINSMEDDDGNVFVWKSSHELEKGSRYKVKGTVKEHSEYRGAKQTVLTRCKTEFLSEILN